MGFGQEDHKNAILITFVAYIPSAWLITVDVKSQPYHLVVIVFCQVFPLKSCSSVFSCLFILYLLEVTLHDPYLREVRPSS